MISKQSHYNEYPEQSAEDTKYDTLVSMKKSELAEIIIEIENDTDDLKEKLHKSQTDWADAISKMHAFETLYKLARKENDQLHKDLKDYRGY